jgi:hypothetical protein
MGRSVSFWNCSTGRDSAVSRSSTGRTRRSRSARAVVLQSVLLTSSTLLPAGSRT